MRIIMLLISSVLTMFLPVVSIPISIFGFIFSRGKIRKGYGFLLALSLATVAYMWVPDQTMDLYRHHLQVSSMADYNYAQLGSFIKDSLEPVCYLVEFIVAQMNNVNLLQFIVVLIGYFELFWLLGDLADLKKIRKNIFTLAFFYVFVSLYFINFASGLWFNFAVINIAMGTYLYYFKGRKYLRYLFYAFAAFIHLGSLYVSLLVLIFSNISYFKKKRISTILFVFFVALSLGGILLLFSKTIGNDSTIASMFIRKYDSYFLNDDKFGGLHIGWNLYLPVASSIICLIMALWHTRRMDDVRYSSFTLYLAVSIIATIVNAGVFIRYGFLLSILTVPMLVDYFENVKDKKKRLILLVSICLLIILNTVRYINQMNSAGLIPQIETEITNSVFVIIQ